VCVGFVVFVVLAVAPLIINERFFFVHVAQVWSNMRFLRARYPDAVEARVRDWGGLDFLFELDKKRKQMQDLSVAVARKFENQ
jgi:hypothetical protein